MLNYFEIFIVFKFSLTFYLTSGRSKGNSTVVLQTANNIT